MMKIALSLDLQGSNRRASKAWLEERDAPPEVQARVREMCHRLGKPFQPVRLMHICWEPGEAVRLPEDFWKHVGLLATEADAVLPYKACEFWERFGPLWPVEDYSLPWPVVRRELARFNFLAQFWYATQPRSKGLPPPLGHAESLLDVPARLEELATSPVDLTILGVTDDGGPQFSFAGSGDWFIIPPLPSGGQRPSEDYAFPDRETGLAWVRKKVLIPSTARLLRRSTQFVPVVSDRVSLKASCDNAFALAAAQMVLGMAEYGLCSCGCGSMVPQGRKYASRKCYNKVRNQSPYRKVLVFLNRRKGLGKLSKGLCKEGHRLAKELRSHYGDYENLKQAVLARLERKGERRDGEEA